MKSKTYKVSFEDSDYVIQDYFSRTLIGMSELWNGLYFHRDAITIIVNKVHERDIAYL